MRKKTFKIFLNSFIVSLFAIWAGNELFAVAPQKANSEISIPEKNIALFFRSEGVEINSSSSTPIRSLSLAALAPRQTSDEVFIDKNLFVFDDDEEENGIQIASVEDAANIPLEYNSERKPLRSQENIIKVTKNDSKDAADSINNEEYEDDIQLSISHPVSDKKENTVAQTETAKEISDTNVTIALNETQTETINDNFIPLELGNSASTDAKIEIANKAPKNQIAMAEGGKIDLESIAIEQNVAAAPESTREWHEMTANDSPWTIAKGARHPKNSQVLEETYSKEISDSQISDALNAPKPMAQDGEVKVAEMVKNILIPIPENILNDKNLTPQLVSPKKNIVEKKDTVAGEEGTEMVTDKEEKGTGLLKSLASIFTAAEGSDINTNNDGIETGTNQDQKNSKKKGFLSVFGKDKAPAKILPAEMKLSFQPGRAEISGTTLRWIQAFANKVTENENIILEVRIDQASSFDLQQKRLNLLHNILTNKGVEYEKINVVFTSREPNSFIIRTLRVNENVNNDMQKNNNRQTLNYQSW